MNAAFRGVFGLGCALCLLTTPTPLGAQNSPTPLLDRLIGIGDRVRISIPGTIIESALVQNVTSDSLHVAEGGQEWFLVGERIEALSVEKRKTLRFAVGGTVAGVLLGLAGQVFLNPILCGLQDDCDKGFAKGALISGGIFGVGLGLVGYHEREWRPLIP